MKKTISAVSILLVSGCTTVSYNGGGKIVDRVSYPEINQTVTAQIGDHLVEKGSLVKESVIQIRSRVDGFLYNIPVNTYRQIGEDSENTFYQSLGVTHSLLADPVKALSAPKDDSSKICVISIYGGTYCYSADYINKSQISINEDGFKQTLIYNGRIGNKINVGYREFSNNNARPAFNNEVEYDLSSSKVIGYKGARIEVLNADNNQITYKLIANFPD